MGCEPQGVANAVINSYSAPVPNAPLSRRTFLKNLSCTAMAMPWVLAHAAENYPPCRTVTKGPGHYWRGYYDKLLFDPSSRFLLANCVSFEHRSPAASDVIEVGLIDLEDGDRWTRLGETRAWNWQQGCMLQWIPGSKHEVAWNDRQGTAYVTHILNIKTGALRTLPHPFYCLSPDGRWAVAPDFRRLNDTRPGYGYAGVPDPKSDVQAPEDAGIWKMDLRTGKRELLISFADAAAIPYPGGFSSGAKHWFNHLLFNTDGTRFLFLHRWRGQAEGKNWSTRMFTCDPDGKNLHILDPHGKTSHFVWRDPRHVMAWAWHPSHGERFYVYRDRTSEVEVVGKDVMTRNGHNTYLPRSRNKWVLNDTYPDKDRFQHPYLCHLPTLKKVPIGKFHLPEVYAGEWRCDLHPSASPNGKLVSVDAPLPGQGRQVHIIDISELT